MTLDIVALVASMTLDEKAALTAGEDLWSTLAVDRVGIPKVFVTDGPNGARGAVAPGAEGIAPAACVPCGSALGATWSPEIAQRVGAMLGREARNKGCRVLLAPTVNIPRSPLAGRNFECYSEDPLLSGRLAAAFVRGVQSHHVATTVKHFAGNDAETQRNTMSSAIDDRALREIYLVPFEVAVRDGRSIGVMTGYNRLNERHCSEHEELLAEILRRAWGFEGFVISDWMALGTTVGAARAGLNLEMPGPGRFFGPAVAEAVRAGDLDEATLDQRVIELLSAFDRTGALNDPPAGVEPQAPDRPEHRALAREAASEALVLLTNDGILPLVPGSVTSLAVVGPNAERTQIMGGGSASVRPHYEVSILEALRSRFGPKVVVGHEMGCDIYRLAPPLEVPLAVEFFGEPAFGGEIVARTERVGTHLVFFGVPASGVPSGRFSFRARGLFRPDEGGAWTFSLIQAGEARLLLDGQVVLDGIVDPPPRGDELFGLGSQEVTANIELQADHDYELVIEFTSSRTTALRAVKIGGRRPSGGRMERAVALAESSDAAIVVVGTNAEWESEGHDRTAMELPGRQEELIRRVVAANPNTVVIVNAGAPVTMSWADDARAVMQVWFGGQELGPAVAAVLSGDADPGGRLPTTIPARLEHNPSFGTFPGENSVNRYGEGLLVGYRWYEARHLPVRFAFGHGLSYSTFEESSPRLSAPTFTAGDTLGVELDVTNTGARRAAHVVQCYVAPPASRLARPVKELKAFAKLWLDPGASAVVSLELRNRSFAYWDPGDPEGVTLGQRLAEAHGLPTRATRRPVEPGWQIEAGEYELHIGPSSADIAHVVRVTVTADARLDATEPSPDNLP